MKTAIPTIALIIAGTPLMLEEAGFDFWHPSQLEKVGMIAACLVAIIFLWKELKSARQEFISHLTLTEEKKDNLVEKRLESDERLTHALDGLTRATEKSIASSDRSVRMIEDLHRILQNSIKNL